MLLRLFIQNYALIQRLDLDLTGGFTAITGETGSGKSILLGALGLTLGERADSHVLFEKNVKCIVESEFDLENIDLKDFFQSRDLDYHITTTLRREISPTGRSRAFVNDSPVQLNVLRELADKLVELHSQHQTLLMRNDGFQLTLLDMFADNDKLLEQYQNVFHKHRIKQNKLRELRKRIDEQQIDEDYLQFQLEELDNVILEVGKDAEILEEFGLLENAQEIKVVLQEAMTRIDQDNGLLDQLNSLSSQVDKIAGHSKGLDELSGRVRSLGLELDDIRNAFADLESQVELDPERQALLGSQIDSFQRLFSKHKVRDVEGLIELKKELESKLISGRSAQKDVESVTNEIEVLEQELQLLSKELTRSRFKAKDQFIKKISARFNELSLSNARIDISIGQSSDYHLFGIDDVNILFNANKGGELEDLSAVASGGELSRLMLILKGEMAQVRNLPTLIFDEIDTGVSGEIASQMAGKLRSLSEGRQVISITHLAQVAARAHQHFRISKSDLDDRSITNVVALDHDERILELAKMLSGTRLSDASIANAKDLMSN